MLLRTGTLEGKQFSLSLHIRGPFFTAALTKHCCPFTQWKGAYRERSALPHESKYNEHTKKKRDVTLTALLHSPYLIVQYNFWIYSPNGFTVKIPTDAAHQKTQNLTTYRLPQGLPRTVVFQRA